MSRDERWFPSHLRELDQSECLDLIAAHQVGRVAYCDDLGPVVVPVNYALDQGTILIQVSPHSNLARHLQASSASFRSTSSTTSPKAAGAFWCAAMQATWTRPTFRLTKAGLTPGQRANAPSTSGSPHATSPAAASCLPE
jgi:pyridoxamine 5'-phosphate oxidase-like protein